MTIREWLNQLAASDTSTMEDSQIMQGLLRRGGLPRAKVVYGVVYPEGHGRPVSIQAMAKRLLAPATG